MSKAVLKFCGAVIELSSICKCSFKLAEDKKAGAVDVMSEGSVSAVPPFRFTETRGSDKARVAVFKQRSVMGLTTEVTADNCCLSVVLAFTLLGMSW